MSSFSSSQPPVPDVLLEVCHGRSCGPAGAPYVLRRLAAELGAEEGKPACGGRVLLLRGTCQGRCERPCNMRATVRGREMHAEKLRPAEAAQRVKALLEKEGIEIAPPEHGCY